jgi:hypothetical protein
LDRRGGQERTVTRGNKDLSADSVFRKVVESQRISDHLRPELIVLKERESIEMVVYRAGMIETTF